MNLKGVAVALAGVVITISVATIAYVDVSNTILSESDKCHRFWMSSASQEHCEQALFDAHMADLSAQQATAAAALERSNQDVARQKASLGALQESIDEVNRRHP
jgi:hypothetical protein